MQKTEKISVPVCATVSRKTGEIRFEYSEAREDQLRFGQVMNRISRIADAYADARARKSAGARCGAAE